MDQPRHAHLLLLSLLLWPLAGCAALGGGGGGGDELPNRGIVPWERFRPPGADGPEDFVLAPADPGAERLTAPSAVVVDDVVHLYYEVRPQVGESPSRIERAVSGPAGLVFGAPEVVLDGADAPPWLGTRPSSPSVVGYEGTWIMAVSYGAGEGFALAWSLDGEAFAWLPEPALIRLGGGEAGGVLAPALVADDDLVTLYYEARTAAGVASIRSAIAGWDLAFERAGVVLQPGVACAGPDGQPESCWDAGSVGSPEVRVATSAAGTPLLRLFYSGTSGSKGSLGFAASWDGDIWDRYAFNPIVDDSYDQREPSNVRLGDHYVLYVAEEQSKTAHGIAAFVNAEGHPNEHF